MSNGHTNTNACFESQSVFLLHLHAAVTDGDICILVGTCAFTTFICTFFVLCVYFKSLKVTRLELGLMVQSWHAVQKYGHA